MSGEKKRQHSSTLEEEVVDMLREVRKAVELEKKMKIGEEIVKMEEEVVVEMKEELSGLPKPSFLANQVAADQQSQKEAPPPRKKKKGKKTVRFLLTSVSKRKLHLDDEEEEEVEGLKRSREERLLAEELDQIGSMMANMFQKSKFVNAA